MHRLALALGKTAGEVRKMPLREFCDWQDFAAVHPFPADLIDLHGAQALALQANMNRGKNQPPYRVEQFLVLRRVRPDTEEKRGPTEAELLQARLGR